MTEESNEEYCHICGAEDQPLILIKDGSCSHAVIGKFVCQSCCLECDSIMICSIQED